MVDEHPSSKIKAVEAFAVPVPFRRRFVIGSSAPVGQDQTGDVVFVKITTADGAVGWGEQRALPTWSYETVETIMAVIEKHLAPLLLDLTPFDVETFHRRAAKALSPSVSNGFPFAKAALDIAMHDAAGKLTGLPVHRLLGGAVEAEIPLCSAIGINTPEAMVEQLQDSRDCHAYKIKISGDRDHDLLALRTAAEYADGKPLWLDANQAYRPAGFRRLLRDVGDLPGLFCIEQPVPSTDWGGMQRLRADLDLPVALDEGSFTAADLARSAVLGAVDLVVIKVCKSGGLRQAQRTAAVAQAHGVEILASGLTDCGIGFAAAVHLFATMDIALPAELNGPELLADLFVDGLQITDAIAAVPDGPGLGIEVDEERIRGLALGDR